MSATNLMENGIAALIFNNTDLPNIGDAAGLQNSAVAGVFYISLHTADPGEAGAQNTSETGYTGYARVAVPRTAGGWTVAGALVSNAALVTFGVCTASPGPAITHFGIGSAASGAGNLFFKGALLASYTPTIGGPAAEFPIGDIEVTVD